MKIRIIGPVGSGKTILANQISVRTGLPVTSLDELNWERLAIGDRHREPVERQELLEQVLTHDDWVIEGTQYRAGQAVFDAADIIYVIDRQPWQVYYYIFKRWFQNQTQSGLTQYRQLRPYLRWYQQWLKSERATVLTELTKYADKTVILKAFDKIKVLE